MSSATTSAPPMTRIHSRTARPTRLGGAAGRSATAPSSGAAPVGDRGVGHARRAGFAGTRLLGDHESTVPRNRCDLTATTAAAAVVAKNSGSSSGPRPIDRTSIPARARSVGRRRAPRRSRRWCGGGTANAGVPAGVADGRRPGAARRNAAVVWWLTPWWRGRGSASDVRGGDDRSRRRGRRRRRGSAPPRARSCRGSTPVPTTPGPMATTTTSAPATATARASADGTLTASRSPPKAWPAVTVHVEQRPLPQRGHQVGQGERQRGAVGHHVGDARAGLQLLERPRRRCRPGCAARRRRPAGRRGRARPSTAPAPRPRRCRPAGSCSGAS